MSGRSEIYGDWASVYESFEGKVSGATWRDGIVVELSRLGCGRHRILDIGAGTGIGRRALREAFPSATVISLDQSQIMLDAGGVPADERLVGDMSCFEVDMGSFDYVVCGFDALNYLDPYRLASCFQCVAAALRPGGSMVFDYSSRQLIKWAWGDLHTEREKDGYRLVIDQKYESLLDRTRTVLRLEVEGRTVWTETHHHYAIDPFELDELASDAGLVVAEVRDIDRRTFSPASITHVYVLHRRGAPASG